MPKRDLFFSKQMTNAAGSLGFAPDPRAPIDWDQFGAFITNPISMRHRAVAETPTLIEYPGGVLLHTGLPNPGFRSVLQQHARSWAESNLPIIPNLMADRPDETRAMVRQLEGMENILAVELGFAPLLADDIILLAVDMSMGELPVIVSLPSEQLLRLGPKSIQRGAAALSISPPRGALTQNGDVISGRLFGRSLLPQTVQLVQTATKIGLPIVASGGVFSAGDAQILLSCGAIAVEIDICLWLPWQKKKSLVG